MNREKTNYNNKKTNKMKKNPFMLASLMLAAVALTGCGSDDVLAIVPEEPPVEEPTEQQPPEEPTEEPKVAHIVALTDAQKTAVQKNNEFAFNFFRAISQSPNLKGKSFMVSPLSLTYALGMANAGATGQTSEEITRLLGFGADDKEAVNALCKQLIDEMPKVDEKVTLSVADFLAADKSVTLMERYRQTLADWYDAEVASLDFASPRSVEYVNNWCREHTGGLIPKMADQLDGPMVLLNAVYFKAPWHSKFDPAETRDETFTREDGSTVTMAMMHRDDATIFYPGDTDPFTVLTLTYGEGHNWLLHLVLPNKKMTVDETIEELTAGKWAGKIFLDDMANMKMDIDVLLPRFKVECDIDLLDVLKGMGATSMFEPRNEFPFISENYKDLCLDRIRQRTVFELTEEGSEATAMTKVHWSSANGPGGGYEPFSFHATRPFIYLIQERTTGAIFFMGTYRGE